MVIAFTDWLEMVTYEGGIAPMSKQSGDARN